MSVARAGSSPRSYAARRRAGDRAPRPCPSSRRTAGGTASRRVDRRGERLVGAAARVGLGLEQVVEPLVAEALDLGLGERRVEGDLGEQLERRLEAGGRHVDADATSRPSRPRRGATRPSRSRGLDEGDRVVALGALGQRPRGEDGRAGVGRRLVGGAVAEDERRARRAAGPGRSATTTRQAVRAGAIRSTAGKSYGRGVPGVGPLGDDLDVRRRSCRDLLVGARRRPSRRRPRPRVSAGGSSGR